MNPTEILHKVASTLSLYEPKPDEKTIIDQLLREQLIMPVKEGKRSGYHITIHGVKWRQAQFGHYQGSRG